MEVEAELRQLEMDGCVNDVSHDDFHQGSSSSDEDGSCIENDLVEAYETELQNFACDIKEGDYYAYVKDEVCYVNGDEGSDYEFDERL
ncbi:hypothetical protein ZWY2020_018046 [Hordeum vulgare]|nr:hypothetical protein ZWY2020_018046 [Hordeum vulgare]